MGKALHKLGLWMDDFTIKKKFYIFYVVCVLIPLIVTVSLRLTPKRYSPIAARRISKG